MRRLVTGLLLGFGLVVAHAKDAESRIVSVAAPRYPDVARHAKLNGSVEVTVSVDGSGAFLAHVLKSSSTLFEEAALAAARKWRLHLGQGEDVTLTFRFTMLPPCSVPELVQIYSPPFVVDVFAAARLPQADDGPRLTCPEVSIADGSGQ